MATTPHILVVSGDPEDGLEYAVECPGVTEACQTWFLCKECPDSGNQDALDESDIVHGVAHRWYSWGWSTARQVCFVVRHDDLFDAASDLVLDPGRYRIDWTAEDESGLSLHNPELVTR